MVNETSVLYSDVGGRKKEQTEEYIKYKHLKVILQLSLWKKDRGWENWGPMLGRGIGKGLSEEVNSYELIKIEPSKEGRKTF